MVECKSKDQKTCDLLVIGSGPEALHVVSRLPETVAKKTIVVDPSGSWLDSWWTRCCQLEIEHLRTPVTLHPSPSPLDLRSYAIKHNRENELNTAVPDCAPLPSASLFHDFCISRVVKKLPTSLRSVLKATVTDIIPLQPGSQGCLVLLDTGDEILASAVVVATSHCSPVVPSWAITTTSTASTTTSTTISSTEKDASKEAEALTPPSPFSGICTWDKVDLRCCAEADNNSKILKQKNVVVVGGGMTAVSLALGAASHGAGQVTLLARRPLVRQQYACDVGWWGNKYLNSYWQTEDPEERCKQSRRARPQASINSQTWDKLVNAVVSGSIKVVEGVEVSEAKLLGEGEGGDGDTTCELVVGPSHGLPGNSTTHFQLAVKAVAFKKKDSSAQSTVEEEGGGSAEASSLQNILADAVWLACGSAYNAATRPLLSGALQNTHPTRLVAGYPVLDLETCLWPGAPVYIIGRGAMLAVGPSAGDLAGMRLAADRIARSLKRVFGGANALVAAARLSLGISNDNEGSEGEEEEEESLGAEEWAAAAQRVAPQLVEKEKDSSSDTNNNNNSQQLGTGVFCSGPWRLPIFFDESDGLLALEEQGKMILERRARASVSRPIHLIDISDLPSTLPRHQVQKFSIIDDGFKIGVVLTLPEGVPASEVRTLVTERSLEVWAVGKEGAYRLHVPLLYGKVLPVRTRVRVNEGKKRVTVTMHKEKDAEWRFLKG